MEEEEFYKYKNSLRYKIKVETYYFKCSIKRFFQKIGDKLYYGLSYKETSVPDPE